ncbi:MAG: hypothetical protein ACFB0B_11210, partial [Thermonemataceae bacterium]
MSSPTHSSKEAYDQGTLPQAKLYNNQLGRSKKRKEKQTATDEVREGVTTTEGSLRDYRIGREKRDNIRISRIIKRLELDTFYKENAEMIERFYEDIRTSKKLAFRKGQFNTRLNPETGKEEVPTEQPYSDQFIEQRKRAYRAYWGYQVFKRNLPAIKRNLKEGLFNSVDSEEAIAAYKLLDQAGSLYVRMFYTEYPSLAARMETNLPIEFRRQIKVAFQRGFRRYEFDEKGKKIRTNARELYKDFKAALAKERAGKQSNLTSILYIVVEAGLENKILENDLRATPFPPKRRQYLEKKFPSVFNLSLVDKKNPDRLKGGVKEGTENIGGISAALRGVAGHSEGFWATGFGRFLSGIASIFKLTGKLISFAINKEEDLHEFDLTEYQAAGAGTVGGFAFTRNKRSSPQDYQRWLEEKKVFQPGDERDAEDKQKTLELDAGELSVRVDLRDEENNDSEQENTIRIFANALPFASLDNLSPDMSLRAEGGIFQNLFASLSWDAAPKGQEEQQAKAMALQLLLRRLVFHDLRVIFEEETYVIGKLQLKNIEVNATQMLSKAGDIMDGVSGIGNILASVAAVAIASVQKVIAGLQGKEEGVATASEGLKQALALGYTAMQDFNLEASDITIENFYSSSMGGIGKLELGKTALQMKNLNAKAGVYAATEAEKKELEELRAELVELLEDRADSKRENAEQDLKIRRLRNKIALKENQLAQKHGDIAFRFGLDTKSVVLKEAELLEKMLGEMLLNGFKEQGIAVEGFEGIDDFSLPGGLTLGTFIEQAKEKKKQEANATVNKEKQASATQVSGNDLKNLGLRIEEIHFNKPITIKKLNYQLLEDILGDNKQVLKDEQGQPLKKEALQAIGENIAFEGLKLGVTVNFADYDAKGSLTRTKEGEHSLFKSLQIHFIEAEKATFEKFTLKMPRPDKADENYKVVDFQEPVIIEKLKIDLAMSASTGIEKLGLSFEKFHTTENKQLASILFEYYGGNITEGEGQHIAGALEMGAEGIQGLDVSMKGDDLEIGLRSLDIEKITLDALQVAGEGFEISCDHQFSVDQIALRGLKLHVNPKEGIFRLDELKKFKIQKMAIGAGSGRIVVGGTRIPLKNTHIEELEATDLKLDFSEGVEGLFDQFKQGKIEAKRFNVHNLVMKSLFNLDKFNATSLYIERTNEKRGNVTRRRINFGAGLDAQISQKFGEGMVKLGGKTYMSGAYYEETEVMKDEFGNVVKDEFGEEIVRKEEIIKADLSRSKLRFELNNAKGQQESGGGISTKKVSLTYNKTRGILDFNLGENASEAVLSLDQIFYYKDKDHFIKRSDIGKEARKPFKIINPRARVQLLYQTKKVEGEEVKTLVGYKLVNFEIDKIAGSNLEVKMGDFHMYIPPDKEAYVEHVKMNGTFMTATGESEFSLETGKLDIEEVGLHLFQMLLLHPHLSISGGISLQKKLDGETNVSLKGVELALITERRSNRLYKKIGDKGSAFLGSAEEGEKASLFQSGEITIHQKDGKSTVIISNPVLNDIKVLGSIGDIEQKVLRLEELILSGGIDGNLLIEDDGQKLLMKPQYKSDPDPESNEGKLLRIERAKLMGDLVALPSGEKEAAASTPQPHPNQRIKDGLARYQFLNVFGGSTLTVDAFGKSIVLSIATKEESDGSKRTSMNMGHFIKGLSTIAVDYLIENLLEGRWDIINNKHVKRALRHTLTTQKDNLLPVIGTKVHETLEGIYGQKLQNRNQVAFPTFAYLIQELAT